MTSSYWQWTFLACLYTCLPLYVCLVLHGSLMNVPLFFLYPFLSAEWLAFSTYFRGSSEEIGSNFSPCLATKTECFCHICLSNQKFGEIWWFLGLKVPVSVHKYNSILWRRLCRKLTLRLFRTFCRRIEPDHRGNQEFRNRGEYPRPSQLNVLDIHNKKMKILTLKWNKINLCPNFSFFSPTSLSMYHAYYSYVYLFHFFTFSFSFVTFALRAPLYMACVEKKHYVLCYLRKRNNLLNPSAQKSTKRNILHSSKLSLQD